MSSVVIVGAGISGLCCAYYLHKSGHEVSIYDSSDLGRECSYGNAGLIVPSHFETLANPGILKKGFKWMLNPNSPFFLKPRFDMDLVKWLIKFNMFCTKKHVNDNKYFLRDINLYSLSLYKDLEKNDDLNFSLKQNGLLMLCKEEKTLEEERKLVSEAKELSLDAQILSLDEIKKLEPNVSFNALGASYFKSDAILQPYDFMMSIKKYLEDNNVKIYENCEIEDVNIQNNKIVSISSKDESISADNFVFTAGIATFKFAKNLNLNLSMEAGKGFSFKVDKNPSLNFSTPLILAEQKVAVSPYDSYVRFGGTMMLAGVDLSLNDRRITNITKAANSYINNLDIKKEDRKDLWAGLRPCSPDGLPYIGKDKNIKNLFVATGHAMMGVSLGPATGKIICDLINNTACDLDISKMDINRF